MRPRAADATQTSSLIGQPISCIRRMHATCPFAAASRMGYLPHSQPAARAAWMNSTWPNSAARRMVPRSVQGFSGP
jgi:hypothetical protein